MKERGTRQKKVSRIWGRDGKETVSEQQKLKCGKERRKTTLCHNLNEP